MTYVNIIDTDQPAHPCNLIRVHAVANSIHSSSDLSDGIKNNHKTYMNSIDIDLLATSIDCDQTERRYRLV